MPLIIIDCSTFYYEFLKFNFIQGCKRILLLVVSRFLIYIFSLYFILKLFLSKCLKRGLEIVPPYFSIPFVPAIPFSTIAMLYLTILEFTLFFIFFILRMWVFLRFLTQWDQSPTCYSLKIQINAHQTNLV